jgi:hypothetical protein
LTFFQLLCAHRQHCHRRFASVALWTLLAFTFAPGNGLGFAHARSPVGAAQEPVRVGVERLSDLDFGRLAKLGVQSGSVTIEANSGNRTIEGGLEPLSGQAHRARFEISGQPGARLRIQLPSKVRIYSSRQQGASVRVLKLRYEIDNNGIIASDGKTTVWVGGTLVVAKSTPPGDYRGIFRIRATYDTVRRARK